MIQKVVMPKTGQTMETGTIIAWRAKVGDHIKKGDILLEIETDKANLEIESFHTGEIKAIIAEEGAEVPIEAVIALIGDASDTVDDALIASFRTQPTTPPSAPPVTTQAPPTSGSAAAPARKGRGPKISPRARRLAEKLGVEWQTLTGTGPAGRIVEHDVEQAAAGGEAKAPAAATGRSGERIAANRIRQLTAERMAASKRDIPCFYLNVKTDVTNLLQRRKVDNESADAKIAIHDYVLEAMAQALVQFPHLTGQWTGDGIQLATSIDVGLAIDTDQGLVAPVVRDADKKTTQEFASATRALIDKANAGKLQPTDFDGASITLSNLGMFGIDEFIPIVVPGQASILGIGRTSDQLRPTSSGHEVRKVMSMTLSVDHRVADGVYAAKFLNAIAERLS